MFAWQDGKVLRLYRSGFTRTAGEFQVQALEAARASGVRVPGIFGTTEVGGRFGIIMERIEGVDLLTLIGRKPWKVWWIGRVTGQAHAGTNRALAPDALPTNHQRSETIIRRATGLPAAYADAALARLDDLPYGDQLLHGDFHPGNVMMQEGRPVILDWSNATRGAPEADFARSRLTLAIGSPPPGTSPIIRVLATFARSLLRNSYDRAYRQALGVDDALLSRWELPVAVVRLAEGIEAERGPLTRHIDRLLAQE